MPSTARLRFCLRTLVLTVVLSLLSAVAVAQVYVQGYYRKDGTYLRPHYRSRPDGIFENNWSTKGNINPYTGKEGTRITPPSKYRGSYSRGGGARSSQVHAYRPSYETSGWMANPHYRGPSRPPRVPGRSTDERIRDVATFRYHGLGFTTTHTQFLRRFPHAVPAGPPESNGVVSYAIEDTDGERDAVWFRFLEQELMCLGYTYDAPLVERYGGAATLLDHATQRFGPPSEKDDVVTIWSYPTIDRTIRAGWHGDTWCLLVIRDSVEDRSANDESGHGPATAGLRSDNLSDQGALAATSSTMSTTRRSAKETEQKKVDYQEAAPGSAANEERLGGPVARQENATSQDGLISKVEERPASDGGRARRDVVPSKNDSEELVGDGQLARDARSVPHQHRPQWEFWRPTAEERAELEAQAKRNRRPRAGSNRTSQRSRGLARALSRYIELGQKRHPTAEEIREFLLLDAQLSVLAGEMTVEQYKEYTGQRF